MQQNLFQAKGAASVKVQKHSEENRFGEARALGKFREERGSEGGRKTGLVRTAGALTCHAQGLRL